MKTFKPTSPGVRQMTVTDFSHLSKVKRYKPLTTRLKSRAGRNNQGRITMRHQGGGVKSLYREVDFMQEKIGVPGRVETLEYDPNRTAFIARIVYKDGERRYILAPDGLTVGNVVITEESGSLQIGHRMQLKNIAVGTFVHNVEIIPGSGGAIGRSAGTSVQVLAHENGYTNLKMPSGEIRKAPWFGYASIGVISNPENNIIVIGKAGRSRHMGVRPTVRGKVMNPRDHPYGGGEGRTQRGLKRPKTKWGKVTGGRKTRNRKKWSNKLILQRRKK